jgi:hypothetical protein
VKREHNINLLHNETGWITKTTGRIQSAEVMDQCVTDFSRFISSGDSIVIRSLTAVKYSPVTTCRSRMVPGSVVMELFTNQPEPTMASIALQSKNCCAVITSCAIHHPSILVTDHACIQADVRSRKVLSGCDCAPRRRNFHPYRHSVPAESSTSPGPG